MGGVVTIPSIPRSKLIKTWLRLGRAKKSVVKDFFSGRVYREVSLFSRRYLAGRLWPHVAAFSPFVKRSFRPVSAHRAHLPARVLADQNALSAVSSFACASGL
jgi:hypothetical protein